MECDYKVMRLILLSDLWKWVPLQESLGFQEGDSLTQLMPHDVTPLRGLEARERKSVVRESLGDRVGSSVVSFTNLLQTLGVDIGSLMLPVFVGIYSMLGSSP